MFRLIKLLSLILTLTHLLSGGALAAEAPSVQVTATVYPLYVTALNIAKDVPGFQLDLLIPIAAGCGHDYQLTTEDLRRVENADLLLYVGMDLEPYLENLQAAYPALPQLPTSVNYELIEDETGNINPHIWMDPQAVMETAKEIARYFSSIDEANSALYQQNLDDYIIKLEALDKEIEALFADMPNKNAVAYHGAFAYFARRYGFNIAADIAQSEDEMPSAGRVAEIIGIVKDQNIPMLWLEDAEEENMVLPILQETGAAALVLSAVTSGEMNDYDAYINALHNNAQLISGALS